MFERNEILQWNLPDVAWILLCKRGKFGEKIYYNSRDIEFCLRDYFLLARPVYSTSLLLVNSFE